VSKIKVYNLIGLIIAIIFIGLGLFMIIYGYRDSKKFHHEESRDIGICLGLLCIIPFIICVLMILQEEFGWFELLINWLNSEI